MALGPTLGSARDSVAQQTREHVKVNSFKQAQRESGPHAFLAGHSFMFGAGAEEKLVGQTVLCTEKSLKTRLKNS